MLRAAEYVRKGQINSKRVIKQARKKKSGATADLRRYPMLHLQKTIGRQEIDRHLPFNHVEELSPVLNAGVLYLSSLQRQRGIS